MASNTKPSNRIGQCEGCNKNAPLILHHWHEDIERSTTYYKYICESCNKFLETKTTNDLNHILPNWELQSSLVRIRLSFMTVLNESPKLFSFSTTSKFRINCELSNSELVFLLHCYPLPEQSILILEKWNNKTNKGNLQIFIFKNHTYYEWAISNLNELLVSISHYNICLNSYNASLKSLGRDSTEFKPTIDTYLWNNGTLEIPRLL